MNFSNKRRKVNDDTKCAQCGVEMVSVQFDEIDYETAKEELETLTSPELLALYESAGRSHVDNDEDVFPTHRLTRYALYDRNQHLVSIDSGLLEEGIEIYASGFVKPVYDDDDTVETGILTKNIGPLNEWWISGFDGGDKLLLGLESCSASYVLLKPSDSYSHFVNKIMNKLYLSKYTIEFLSQNPDSNYEDLIQYITSQSKESIQYNEEVLLSNAGFVIQQVMSYDEAAAEDDYLLFETRCIQNLLRLFGSKEQLEKTSLPLRHIARKDARRSANNDTYATSTVLVREFFEVMFAEAIEKEIYAQAKTASNIPTSKRRSRKDQNTCRVDWHQEATHKDVYSRISYYNSVKINEVEYKSGDFVVTDNDCGIGRLVFMMGNHCKENLAHIHWFCHGFDTILKETCDRRFIFMKYNCANISLENITRKVTVCLSGLPNAVHEETADFVCKKVYCPETGHFEDFAHEFCVNSLEKCWSCEFTEKAQSSTKVKFGTKMEKFNGNVQFSDFYLNNEHYSLDDFVFLSEDSYECNWVLPEQQPVKFVEDFDETLYTEKYRKSLNDFIKGSMVDVPLPLKVGRIKSISASEDDGFRELKIEVIKLYRPENVFSTFEEVFKRDVNELFFSEETTFVSQHHLIGKCDVRLSDLNPGSNSTFSSYFYYSMSYNPVEKTFRSLVDENFCLENSKEKIVEKSKLKTLDLFSGCGGLALGFDRSGVSETSWAVEKDCCAAHSFRINFPKAVVFEEDANYLLKQILNGSILSNCGQKLPQKGDVDLILAGPPCQGFSGINRFSCRQYSLFKNSLIVTLLSYVDYFRPSFLVLENVRTFVQFKDSVVLKLTLSCLLKMDYQVRVGIVQAGAFGVPQSRRRVIIMAAAPNKKLANFPKPSHVFSQKYCQLSFIVDGKKYSSLINHKIAPFRAITVRDAISDLPDIESDLREGGKEYKSEPRSHYQRIMRFNGSKKVFNHVSKQISLLTQARINEIPHFPGSDWRDLPNICLRLSDGTIVNKLVYDYHDVKNGKTSNGKLRGVCRCASGKSCDLTKSRQENTLIPWCLVHTANRQYQWAGLYGRLQWDGFFPTIVTNPEPIGKQGRVIHPQANRIISVRECARSQSFPDNFSFMGGVPDCYRQIGNAVPPLLAFAIANQLKASLEN